MANLFNSGQAGVGLKKKKKILVNAPTQHSCIHRFTVWTFWQKLIGDIWSHPYVNGLNKVLIGCPIRTLVQSSVPIYGATMEQAIISLISQMPGPNILFAW